MKFFIDDLEVIFPYEYVYKEQLEYMTELKRTIDLKGHAILEMPTGTGKTVSLLALIIAYLAQHPDVIKKLIYCTRTVVEMEKTLREVNLVLESRQKEGAYNPHGVKFLAVGLSARRNLCVHPQIRGTKENDRVDAECRKRTAEWVVNQKSSETMTEICQYFQNYKKGVQAQNFEEGCYSLDKLRNYGDSETVCPYFLARELVNKANIVVYNYLYLLDPNVSSSLSKDQKKESVVVFDEAHNIDDVCIEAYSVKLNKPILLEATNNLKFVSEKINENKTDIQNRLQEEYNKLLSDLNNSQNTKQNIPQELNQQPGIIKGIIPGQIRQASNFINFMSRFVYCLRQKLKENSETLKEKYAILKSTKSFLEEIIKEGNLELESLKSCSERLMLLLNTLQIAEIDKFAALSIITQFANLISTYNEGFKIIFQSNNFEGSLHEKYLTLACFDSSLAMKNVFATFQSVVLTSGTMSPLEMYPKILDFKPITLKQIEIDLIRNSIQPIIVTMSEDGTELTSEFTQRNNEDVSKNYANFLVELSENVPDGLIVFMPSYGRMEEWARAWNKDEILTQISKNKILFIESKDVQETSLKLTQFRQACDKGKGGVLLSIARGKIAEGIDFEHHYGRCVAIFGFPALNSRDIIILERCKFLDEKFSITKNDFIEFDAMRQTSQCLGRVMRGKSDYGIMIMVDKRFAQKSKLQKMPRWIEKQLDPDCKNVTCETAISIVRDFFRRMAQKFTLTENSYFTEEKFRKLREMEKQQKEQQQNEQKQMEVEIIK